MGPKYEFTDETLNYDGHILHRIKRLSDDKIGGWIEKEENLSQDGDCWVNGTAKIYEYARIYGNAQVNGQVNVCGCAEIYGNAKVYGSIYQYISDYAQIYGNAQVYYSEVSGHAKVYDNAKVYDWAWIYDRAKVFGNAQIYGRARVYDDAQVYGETKVLGYVSINGDMKIDHETYVGEEHRDAEYYDDYIKNENITFVDNTVKKVVQDFIYKIDDSNKLEVYTGYNSIEEFFNSDVEDDDDLNMLVICSVDTKLPLIKLEKIEKENKLNYRFIVDITTGSGDNFSIKSTIETHEQLNQKLKQTIEALKQYPEFNKYADDLEEYL